MKKELLMIAMLFGAMLGFTGCGGDDDNGGSDSPVTYEDSRITTVIPAQYLSELSKHITIYDGVTPPSIEGVYIMSPAKLIYDSYNAQGIDEFSDAYFNFYNQNTTNNTISLMESGGSTGTGSGALISGKGNNFTIYLNMSGTNHGYTYKTATLITGTKTSSGIKDMRYAFIMLENNDYEEKYIMKPGRYRIIGDGDGMSETTTWPQSAKAFGKDFAIADF